MIREATAADTPRLVAMAERFLASSEYGVWMPSTAEQIAAVVATVMQVGVFYVAEVDSGARVPGICISIDGEAWHAPGGCDVCRPVIVGMLALIEAEHPMSEETYCEEIAWWVEPEHRSGTAGPRLHAAGEAWARARGIRIMRMLSPAGSDLGVYYRRLGYVEVETAWLKRL